MTPMEPVNNALGALQNFQMPGECDANMYFLNPVPKGRGQRPDQITELPQQEMLLYKYYCTTMTLILDVQLN